MIQVARDFWKKVKIFRSILALLVILVILFLVMGFKNLFGLSDFWFGLSTESFFLIAVIFFVDVVLDRRKKAEWLLVREVAKSDLWRLGNILVFRVLRPFGVSDYKFDPKSDDVREQLSKITMHVLKDARLRVMKGVLRKASPASWRHFQVNMTDAKNALDENLALYRTLLPAKHLGLLLKAKQSFNEFYKFFTLAPVLFTESEQDWSKNGFEIQMGRSIREMNLSEMCKNLDTYLGDVEEFINSLESWD